MASATPAPAPPTTKALKRLTEAEWAEAKGLYETGRATKVELAKHFGVDRSTMHRGLTDRGAVYGIKSKVIEDATVEGQKSDAKKRSEDISTMKEGRLKAVNLLNQLQNKVMSEQLTSGRPLAEKYNEIKTLNALIKNTALIRQELWAIYDLDRDPDGAEEIPEFIVSEYTPDEIAALNNKRLGMTEDEALQKLETAIRGEDNDPLDDNLGIDELLGTT